jgi:anti-sigma factor RsiW
MADHRLAAADRERVAAHLQGCDPCRDRYQEIIRFDAAIRELPLVRVGSGFTSSVLGQLHIVPESPLVFRIFERAAYFFILFLVLGSMAAIFWVTGVIHPSQGPGTEGLVGQAMDSFGRTVGGFSSEVAAWLARFLPFIFGKSVLNISVTAGLVAGALGMLDWVLGRKTYQRSR